MATVNVVPDVDGGTNDWNYPIALPHYDDIDEGIVGGTGSDYIGALNSQGDHDEDEQFGYGNPDLEGQTASQVVIWTNGIVIIGGGVYITVNIGGEEFGPVGVGLGTGRAWLSNTFVPAGDNWTEAECAAMKVIYTASVGTDKYGVNLYTSYAQFTYEPPPPPGYQHDYMGVPAANIGSVDGVPTANINTIKGV